MGGADNTETTLPGPAFCFPPKLYSFLLNFSLFSSLHTTIRTPEAAIPPLPHPSNVTWFSNMEQGNQAVTYATSRSMC